MSAGDIDLVRLAGLWSVRLGRDLHPGQVDILLSDIESLRDWTHPEGQPDDAAPLVEVEFDAVTTCGRCWRLAETKRGWCKSCCDRLGVAW